MSDGINPPPFQELDYVKAGWYSSIFRAFQRRTKVVTATTTYAVAPDVSWVRCDATGGIFTVTLPLSSDWGGREIGFKQIDASGNVVTIARASTDTIDGATSKTLTAQYACMVVKADGVSSWDILVKQ